MFYLVLEAASFLLDLYGKSDISLVLPIATFTVKERFGKEHRKESIAESHGRHWMNDCLLTLYRKICT